MQVLYENERYQVIHRKRGDNDGLHYQLELSDRTNPHDIAATSYWVMCTYSGIEQEITSAPIFSIHEGEIPTEEAFAELLGLLIKRPDFAAVKIIHACLACLHAHPDLRAFANDFKSVDETCISFYEYASESKKARQRQEFNTLCDDINVFLEENLTHAMQLN